MRIWVTARRAGREACSSATRAMSRVLVAFPGPPDVPGATARSRLSAIVADSTLHAAAGYSYASAHVARVHPGSAAELGFAGPFVCAELASPSRSRPLAIPCQIVPALDVAEGASPRNQKARGKDMVGEMQGQRLAWNRVRCVGGMSRRAISY